MLAYFSNILQVRQGVNRRILYSQGQKMLGRINAPNTTKITKRNSTEQWAQQLDRNSQACKTSRLSGDLLTSYWHMAPVLWQRTCVPCAAQECRGRWCQCRQVKVHSEAFQYSFWMSAYTTATAHTHEDEIFITWIHTAKTEQIYIITHECDA